MHMHSVVTYCLSRIHTLPELTMCPIKHGYQERKIKTIDNVFANTVEPSLTATSEERSQSLQW